MPAHRGGRATGGCGARESLAGDSAGVTRPGLLQATEGDIRRALRGYSLAKASPENPAVTLTTLAELGPPVEEEGEAGPVAEDVKIAIVRFDSMEEAMRAYRDHAKLPVFANRLCKVRYLH